ncbi:hypothetical protein [Paraflavitalea speifideaquila]|uniref:hypothetical protein n=1 Tax=Paraflavitalea speifideaquila TaxID=3076558 RepID=UPI0028E7E5E9|nr:hypothetical protein [Paraflavitalea speifideiaquila]
MVIAQPAIAHSQWRLLFKQVPYVRHEYQYQWVLSGTGTTFTVHSFSEGMENSFTATTEIRPMKVLATNGLLVTADTVVRVYPLYSIAWNALLKDRDRHTWLVARDTLKCLDSNLKTLQWWKLTDSRLASIQQDAAGTIWYATDEGLARIDSGQLHIVYQGYKNLAVRNVYSF